MLAPLEGESAEDCKVSDLPRRPVGPWTLSDPPLGHGGNAFVWRATRPDAETAVALKVLNVTKAGHESYKRFVREIGFLREHQTIPGLLPLLDAHLPGSRPPRPQRPPQTLKHRHQRRSEPTSLD
jgi:serine/threonine protein kinase